MHAVRALCAFSAVHLVHCRSGFQILRLPLKNRAYKRSVGSGLNGYPCSTARDTDRHQRFPSTNRLPNVLQLAFDKCCRAPTVFRTYSSWSVDMCSRKSVRGSWADAQNAHSFAEERPRFWGRRPSLETATKTILQRSIACGSNAREWHYTECQRALDTALQAPVGVHHHKYCIPGGDSFLSQRLKEEPHIEPGPALPSDNNPFQIKADTEASDCARQTNAADPINNIGTHTDATCNARRQTPVSDSTSPMHLLNAPATFRPENWTPWQW